MDKSVGDVLDAAADLIEPEGRWTQGTWARAIDGERLEAARDDRAVCWCMFGAVIKAGDGQHVNSAGDALCEAIGGEGYLSFNDAPGRTQAEVVQALRTAASLSRQGKGDGA